MNHNEIKNSEIKNSEIKNSEIKNSEIKNSESRNSESRNSEIKNSESRNSEIRNNEIRNNEIKNNEIKNDSIIEAIGLLDDDLIEETRRKRDAEKSGKGIHLIRKFGVVPVAACIVLIIGSISVYAAARIAGVLKVHEGTSNSEKDIIYTYEIPDGYKKIPMSEITGEAAHFADSYQEEIAPDTETETLNDRMFRRNPNDVYFSSIEEAADYIGYQKLNIDPFRIVGKRAIVTIYPEKIKEQRMTETDEASGNNSQGNYVLGGLQLRTENGLGSNISPEISVSSYALIYTENSNVVPFVLGGALSADIKSDFIYPADLSEEWKEKIDKLNEKIENGLQIEDYDNIDEEFSEFEFGYGTASFILTNGSDNKLNKETVIVNDREFEIVTITSKDEKVDPESYRYMVLYQKNVIHVENDIIYTLQVYYGEGEQYEAEEIIQKWMNSF